MKYKYIYLLAVLLCLTLFIVIGAGLLFPKKEPVPVSENDLQITVLDSKIRYKIHAGKNSVAGPVIILIHGFGGSLDHWKEIQPLLTRHKSIALDLVGFGGSDRPSISYDLDSQWRYLHEFMVMQKISNAIVVGISMGGSLSAWTAAKSKDRVTGLIMIAPSGLQGSLRKDWPFNILYRPGIPNRIAWVITDNPLYRWLFRDSMAAQALSVTNSYDSQFAKTLEDVTQPALLAWSKGDDTTLFEYHSGYQSRIKNIEFKELPASLKHDVLRTDPKGTALLINNFIDKLHQQAIIEHR